MAIVGQAYVEIRLSTQALHREASRQIQEALRDIDVEVEISPDLDDFRRKLQAGAKAASAGVEAEIGATVDTSQMRVAVRRAADAAGMANSVEVDLELEDGAVGELRREVTTATAAAGAGQNVRVDLEVDEKGGRNAIRGFSNDIKSLDERALGLGQTLGLVFSPAIAMAAGGIAASVGAIASAAVQATSALTPLVGLIPALGILGSGLGQVAAVSLGAFSGIGDAVKDFIRSEEAAAIAVDTTASKASAAARRRVAAAEAVEESADAGTAASRRFAYAMEQLTPAGRDFVNTILDIRREFIGLRDIAQEEMLPGVSRGLRAAMPLLADARPIVAATARTLGELADRGGHLAASPLFRDTFRRIGEANVGIIASLGDAVLDAAPGFAVLARESIPLAQHIATVAGNAVRAAGGFFELTAQDGRMQEFFNRTRQRFDLVVSIGGDLIRTLFGIIRASDETGTALLTRLGRSLDDLADKINSARGQLRIRDFFADLFPLQIELGRLGEAIVSTFLRITQAVGPDFAPVVAQLRTEFLPAIERLMTNFRPEVLTSIVGLGAAFADFIGSMVSGSPVVVLLVETLSGFLDTVRFLLTEIPVLSPLLTTLFVGLSAIGAAAAAVRLAQLVSQFAGFGAGLAVVRGHLPAVAGLLPGVAAGTAATGTAAGAAAGGVGRLAGAMGLLRTALGGAVGIAALFLGVKGALDAFAPSMDRSVQAVISAENPFRAIQEQMQRLNSPGLWDQFLVTAKSAFSDFPGFLKDVFTPGNEAVEGLRTKFSTMFREIAQASPVTAQQIIDDMRAMGGDAGHLQRILDELKSKHDAAGRAALGQGQQTDGLAQALQRGRDAVGRFTDKLNTLIGVHVSESQALIAFHGNLDILRDKLRENGVSLDLTTEKGRINKGAIDDTVRSIGDHITSLINEGATMDQIRGAFDRHVEDFRRTMSAAGLTEAQIDSLIEEYGLVPDNVRTLLGTDGLEDYVGAMQRARAEAAGVWDLLRESGRIVVEKVANVFTRESGGPLRPDEGFVTNKPVFLVGEGNPQYPEYVVPTDPKYRDRATDLFSHLGRELHMFQAGGVIGSRKRREDWPDRWLDRADGQNRMNVDLAELGRRMGENFMEIARQIREMIPPTGGGYGYQALIDFLNMRGVPHVVTSTTGGRHVPGSLHYEGLAADFGGPNLMRIFDAFASIAPSLNELFHDPAGRYLDMGRWIQGAIGGHGGHVHAATWAGPHQGPGIPGVGPMGGEAGGDAASWIREAIRITGVPTSWFDGLMRRMMQESGGRNIPQQIVDINTRKGTPAFGPMQMIEPTFRAHALPGYEDWRNPLHNTIAAIRYIQSRYGSPYNLPKGGYRFGGIVPFDGPAFLHRDEMVLPKELADLIRSAFDVATDTTRQQPGGPTLTPVPGVTDHRREPVSPIVKMALEVHLHVGSISGGADLEALVAKLVDDFGEAVAREVEQMIRSGRLEDAMSWNALAQS